MDQRAAALRKEAGLWPAADSLCQAIADRAERARSGIAREGTLHGIPRSEYAVASSVRNTEPAKKETARRPGQDIGLTEGCHARPAPNSARATCAAANRSVPDISVSRARRPRPARPGRGAAG